MSNTTIVIAMWLLVLAQFFALMIEKRPKRKFDSADAIGLIITGLFIILTFNIL